MDVLKSRYSSPLGHREAPWPAGADGPFAEAGPVGPCPPIACRWRAPGTFAAACVRYDTSIETRRSSMKIGILGSGHIGKTLTQRLSTAGHDVKVANSRGPETVEADVLTSGGRAVTAAEAVADVDVLILSIPLNRLPDITPLLADVPADTIVVDTSNYYPLRDSRIEAIEAGQVESLWAAELLGRPIAKAWNAIGSHSFATKDKPAGSADRIAIPVAADSDKDRRLAMALVEDTGFDAFDAGTLADSWRQQPGAPSYCTDLTREEMPGALAAAEAERLPKRRDLGIAAVQERVGDSSTNPDAQYLVRLNRALFM
ncbi:NADPH-dependent F420 reductase [Streptomyces sp. NPDC059096]|uniref:NADPH-dependent F420 reductase n=1 Tax=Streptomyces sp. NPDC059096 TaxID=3346727 RepID=UPI00367E3168